MISLYTCPIQDQSPNINSNSKFKIKQTDYWESELLANHYLITKLASVTALVGENDTLPILQI